MLPFSNVLYLQKELETQMSKTITDCGRIITNGERGKKGKSNILFLNEPEFVELMYKQTELSKHSTLSQLSSSL